MKKIFLMVIIVLGWSSLAQAQIVSKTQPIRKGHWDLSFQGRYLGSQEVSADGGSSLSLQDNLGWGMGFHYNFSQKFALGMDFSMHSINYTATLVDANDPSITGNYSNNLDVAKFGVVSTWNVLEGRYTPYLNGAFSWTLIDTNIQSGMEDGCYDDPYLGSVCGTYPTTYQTDNASYSIGVGGRFEMTETFFVRLGYEYAKNSLDAIDGQHLMRIDFGFLHQ